MIVITKTNLGRGRPRKREITIQSEETSIALGVIFLILAGLVGLSILVNDGQVLQQIHEFFGGSSIVAFCALLFLSLRMFGMRMPLTQNRSIFGQFLLVLVISGFLQLLVDIRDAYDISHRGEMGGILGYYVSNIFLIDVLAKQGALFVLLIGFLVSAPLALSLSIKTSFHAIGQIFGGTWRGMKVIASKIQGLDLPKKAKDHIGDEEDVSNIDGKMMISDLHSRDFDESENEPEEKSKDHKESIPELKKVEPVTVEQKKITMPQDTDGEKVEGAVVNEDLQYKKWKLPMISLLNPYTKKKPSQVNIKKSADIIEQTLESFGVRAKVVDVRSGPSVTQFALNIALGTKVAKISNLKNDLALALAAPTGGVRIEAPIPGTSYVGVEIPNIERQVVQIREVVESDNFHDSKKLLPVVVGKNINGDCVVTDIKEMPHLLIAGATGSGKSVLMNGFLISLLMRLSPDELRLILVDPKQVELYDYNGIPHLLTPVITDMEKVLNSLKWAVTEMERRYTILRQAHVRNIESYNKDMGFSAMPFIVIVIDEMADLMLSVGAEVETAIVRLAQKARAVGIHLLLATQRPSVDIITGLIKANVPGRVGMSVATQIDSRVILDQVGAESLLGKGDLLFKEPDKSRPARIQGVWVSNDEIHRVVQYIKDQVKGTEVRYSTEILEKQEEETEAGGEGGDFSSDDLFANAVRIVVQARKGSASLLQRKLSIGYNRAARLLDELQEYGVVGPQEGSKPRQVLIGDAESFLNSRKNTE